MWYRTAQQQVDIGLQHNQSNLNQNTGIYATFAESQKMKKALQDGTYAEISTPSGKMLAIHGDFLPSPAHCDKCVASPDASRTKPTIAKVPSEVNAYASK
jgi:hypothetical protein